MKDAPGIVKFADESNPKTARIVMTYSETKRPEVNLRYFAQPTRDPVTTGIMKHLPWLNNLPSSRLDGRTGELNMERYAHRPDAWIFDRSFVNTRTADRLERARK